jgi:cytochrome c oxidase subunit 1
MLVSYWQGDRVESTDPWDLKRTNQFTREWQWFEDRMVDRYDMSPSVPETTRASYAPEAEAASSLTTGAVSSTRRVVAANASLAAVGGFVGTLLMAGGLGTAALVGVFDLSSLAELAELVGLPRTPLVGAILFLVGGTVTWPLLFLAFSDFLPGRLLFETGLVFATIISSGFAVAFYTGQRGLAFVGFLGFVIVAHWAYGLGLTVTFRYLQARRRERIGGSDGSGGVSADD